MLEDLIEDRQKKLAEIKKTGINPYPSKSVGNLSVAEAIFHFSAWSKKKKPVMLAGRIMAFRDQGGVLFFDLEDGSGKIQAVFKKQTTKNFAFWKSVLDRGDFVAVKGVLFATKRGEKSVDVKTAQILSKSIRPVPDQWFGVSEIETLLRKRYLDLMQNPKLREMFRKKAVFWNAFREFLQIEGFLEVETPILESSPGGAEAEPFATHHNALDTDFYLRISLELSLKKLLVGGLDKVFEIGRIFRNEGMDREHLQDYAQLEFYWAYSDYNLLMKFIEKLYKAVIKKTIGSLSTAHDGQKINWGKKWGVVKYTEAFKKFNKLDPVAATRAELLDKAKSLGLSPESHAGKGRLMDMIFKKTVRPTLIQPVFLIDPPVEIEPLAKRKEDNPALVERFQVMACGTELGKGFSELNDSVDQRARFEEQAKLRAAGDIEAQRLDEDFVEALEYGMPPAAGFGVSERLFAILMDKPVRETVIFPLMRPEK